MFKFGQPRAQWRINGAIKSGDQRLSLFNLGLDELPRSLGQARGLRSLQASFNRFTRPAGLDRRTQPPRDLDIGQNKLSELPVQLQRLPSLAVLDVGSNRRISAIPPWIRDLTRLEKLDISHLNLSGLPIELGELPNLSELNLGGWSAGSRLPAWIGGMQNLTALHLSGTGLDEIPPWIRGMTGLTKLHLSDNRCEIPAWIGELTNLKDLSLSRTGLTEVPGWIADLPELTKLSLSGNKLRDVPDWLGEMPSLTTLSLFGIDNPPAAVGPMTSTKGFREQFKKPPAAVTAQGSQAVQAFREALREQHEQQWRSKLLILGEAQAGKTTLLKALAGRTLNPSEPNTHGLNIENLSFVHPTVADTECTCRRRDFGGQPVYHATHQFFLTDQSLFLLVWNSRLGSSGGRHWLDLIASRTRVGAHRTAAPVLLVASAPRATRPTCRSPISARLPEHRRLRGRRRLREDDTGIDGLRALIADKAASLPLMGSTWPSSWLAASVPAGRANTPPPHRPVPRPARRERHPGRHASQEAVTRVLDKLGEILHYPEDKDLAATVVLKPQWLSERIAAILDSPRVAGRHGLLTTRDIEEQWPDLDTDLRSQILAMMDRYDVSYRIAESAVGDDARAIIVDRLPWEPPEYTRQWEQALTVPQGGGCASTTASAAPYRPEFPAGSLLAPTVLPLPATGPGATACCSSIRMARISAACILDRADGTVHLEVRGPRRAGFLGMLDLYFLDAVLGRYPGLAVTRSVPCGCRPSCPTSWPYDKLVHLYDTLGQSTVQCIESGMQLSIADLIDGIAPSGPVRARRMSTCRASQGAWTR